MSQQCTWAVPPSFSMMEIVSLTAAPLMSTRNTSAPCRANSVAVARPLPHPGPTDPAPVTIATFAFMLSTQLPPTQLREDASQPRGRPEGPIFGPMRGRDSRSKSCEESAVITGASPQRACPFRERENHDDQGWRCNSVNETDDGNGGRPEGSFDRRYIQGQESC